MAIDFSKPLLTDTYSSIVPALQVSLSDLAKWLEPTLTGTSTNIPSGVIRYNATSVAIERFNGTSWAAMPFKVGSGTTDTGAFTTLSASSNLSSGTRVDAPIYYDSNNTGYYVDPNSLSKLGQLTVINSRGNSGGYSAGHYSSGSEDFSIDPTWSTAELQAYFNSANVSWVNDATAPGGYTISIVGAVNVGGAYGSGFPYIPIDTSDIFYMEVWIKNVTGTNTHYMGSIDYNEAMTSLGGNPGSYGYWVMSNSNPGTSWVKYSGYISGFGTSTGQFVAGAKYWTPQALFNYTGGGTTYISGWKVYKVTLSGNRVFSGNITSGGTVTASGTGGFSSATYAGGVRNPIWRFGNADGYGLSYFQGAAGIGSADTIGVHFGTATAAGSQFQFNTTSTYFYSSGSLRTPIFYDSDNTGYYTDPASTSNVNTITAGTISSGILGVNQTAGNTGAGLSLYNGAVAGTPTYGIMFQLTSSYGTHGSVTADWATYFTMNNTANRGWIFRDVSTPANVASISNGGIATFSTLVVNSSSTAGYFGSLQASWAGGTSYPTLYGGAAERWVMLLNPHISYTVNGSNGYTGSMTGSTIRFASDAAATSYWDIGVNGGAAGLGTDVYGITRAGVYNLKLDNGGNVYSRISHRSPIFYDLDNTAYYADPASTSSFNAITSVSESTGSINTNWIYHNDIDRAAGGATYYPNVQTRAATFRFVNASSVGTGGNYAGMLHFSPWTGTTASTGDAAYQLVFGSTATNGAGNPQLVIRNGIDTTWNAWRYIPMYGLNQYTSSFYATIYYDSDNTGYYSDPASTSNQNAITLAGTLTLNASGNAIVMNGSGSTNIQMNAGSVLRGYMYSDSSGVGILNSAGAWAVQVPYGQTYTTVTASIRAPLFYDTDNTAYYADPASTSVYNILQSNGYFLRSAHSTGYLAGSYNNIGANDAKSNPIYTIGTAYAPTDTLISNMYGIGYSHSNFFGTAGGTDWGLYVVAAGAYSALITGAGAWFKANVTAYSDARVKYDIKVIDNPIEKVKCLNGYTYLRTDMPENSPRQTGVIAQEVLKVLPEAVSGNEEEHYSVAYGNMVGLLIEAIKEQQKLIEELKLRIDNAKL